jgi:hypothetical protein
MCVYCPCTAFAGLGSVGVWKLSLNGHASPAFRVTRNNARNLKISNIFQETTISRKTRDKNSKKNKRCKKHYEM